jgi:hypothetical protein
MVRLLKRSPPDVGHCVERRGRSAKRPRIANLFSRLPYADPRTKLAAAAAVGRRVPRSPARRTAIKRSERVQIHCQPRHSVQIEPGLRPQSPENGNISKNCRRLSTISACKPSNRESGDRLLNCKSPPLAAFSAMVRGRFPDRRTAWLGREDSNLRMGESKSPALPLGDAPMTGPESGGYPRGFLLAAPVYRERGAISTA